MMQITMQIFSAGKMVVYRGRTYRIQHNAIRGEDVYVYLEGMESPIHTRDLWVEPTTIELKRKN